MASRRLLLVEDSDLVARVVARTLRGVEVVTAASGEAALERLAETDFGMALVDVGLDTPTRTAWRSGVELAVEIRQRCPALMGRIYLFTGHGDALAGEKGVSFPVVAKPITDISAFRALVRGVLED